MDKPQTFEDCWHELVEAIGGDMSPDSLQGLKQAFYSGAWALTCLQRGIVKTNDPSRAIHDLEVLEEELNVAIFRLNEQCREPDNHH